MASLQSYMVEQLHSFDIGIPTASLSYQTGVLQGSFTFAQIIISDGVAHRTFGDQRELHRRSFHGLVVAFLEETLATKRQDRCFRDQMTRMYRGVVTVLFGQTAQRPGAPVRKIWTPNVLWTLLSVAIFDLHMGAFSGLWIIFLSTPRTAPDQASSTNAIHFTGGLASSPFLLGSSLAILEIVGFFLQVLLYPWANSRFGLMRCFRYSLLLFPLAYVLAPYLALLPSATAPPQPAAGALV
ncbi:transmembrane transport [Ascochyta rabiei]|uniref:Transmembrane transport n=1 Tax=Didymella rabiei TaxID=5454 RepID=A0A163DTV2_DIDRA|nr:transmembrane transport [Ascochyta rabiei]